MLEKQQTEERDQGIYVYTHTKHTLGDWSNYSQEGEGLVKLLAA